MVIELRAALGDTQEKFAARLRTALSTVARYETSRPPTGGMLMRLAAIAERNAIGRKVDDAKVFTDLATTFKRLYLDEVFQEMGVDHNMLVQFPDGEMYVLAKFKNVAIGNAILRALAKGEEG